MEICHACSAMFRTRSSLNRHLRKVHGYELPQPVAKRQCSFCEKKFTATSSLNRHTNTVHKDIQIQCAEERNAGEESEVKVKCEACDSLFVDKSTMHRHMKRSHNQNPTNSAVPALNCPHCDLKFRVYQDIDDHLIAVHGFCMEMELMEFETMEKFLSWKTAQETITFSSFVKRTSKGNTTYYVCHRSGTSRCRGNNGKQLKAKVKTGKCCPARIKTFRNEKSIKVVFYKTHTGHTQSIEYLRLSKVEQCMLALEQNVQ